MNITEESKGKRRARKQTWPWSQFCLGPRPSEETLSSSLKDTEVGLEGPKLICPGVLSLQLFPGAQAQVKRAAVSPPELPVPQKQHTLKSLFSKQELRAETDPLTLPRGHHSPLCGLC